MIRASVNGRPVEHEINSPEEYISQDVQVRIPPFELSGHDVIELEFEPTIEILPPLIESAVGDDDKGLKIIRLAPGGKTLTIMVEGLAGHDYILRITGSGLVAQVTGATLDEDRLLIRIPGEKGSKFVKHEVIVRLK
jgi:hypothetical protein